MLLDFLHAFIFLFIGVFFVSLAIIFSRLLHPRKETPEKYTTYECGEEPVGESWIRFNNRFYIIALVFIIFDIEIVFLFPWAMVYKKIGMIAFIDMLIFVAILLVGFAYAWAKGDLEWVKSYFTDKGEVLRDIKND